MENVESAKAAIKKIQAGFTALSDALGGEDEEEKDVISPSKLRGSKGKGKKAKAVEEDDSDETEEDDSDLEIDEDADAEEDSDEEDSEDDEESDDEEDDSEDEGDEDETVNELELKNLKKALKAYSAKNGKPKAVKILNKFAKASQDVKRKDFAKLLKLLKV